MDENRADNTTIQLAQVIMDITYEQRRTFILKSVCHYIYCQFSMDDYESTNKSTCHAIPTTILNAYQTQDFYALITKYIYLYIYPLFILMGILGNKLSCFLMFINARRSGYPTSLYLTLLAFVDGLYLLGSALPEWISKVYYKVDIKTLSDFSCRFIYWFGNFTTHLSAGLVVGVTIERFVAVQYPLMAHKINTVTHTRVALLILIIFFILIDGQLFLLVKNSTENIHVVASCHNDTMVNYERRDMIRCGPVSKRYERNWVYMDFAMYNLIPFLIIITLNSLIIRRLIDAQRFRQRMFRFSNHSSRQHQQDIKYRHYSDSQQAIEIADQNQRYLRCFQSVSETKPLVVLLRPQSSQTDERRIRYSTKQSSTSTELSTVSCEVKNRSRRQYEMTSIRCKSINASQLNHLRLTILLLFVSFSFLILTLPVVTLNLILSKKSSKQHNSPLYALRISNDYSEDRLYYTIARLFMITNHSINFILYFILGKRFRHDFKELFIGYWRKLYR